MDLVRVVNESGVKLGTVAIYVNDTDKAVCFWTEKIGFMVYRRQSAGHGGDWVEVGPESAGTWLLICPRSADIASNQRSASIVFECADLTTSHADLAGRGVNFAMIPKDMPWGHYAV